MSKNKQQQQMNDFIDPDSSDLRGFAQSIVQISALLILLSIAYLYFGDIAETIRFLYICCVVAFSVFVFGMRLIPKLRQQLRTRLALEAVAMIFFITALDLMTGALNSPLLNLYLLPLVVSCIVLGRGATIGLLILVACCFFGLSVWAGEIAAAGSLELVGMVIRFAPIVLVTYLTSLLAENIRSTRRQILSMSEKDDLTELYNMRAFTTRLQATHMAAVRHNQTYGIAMIDVDNLKPINDEFGHESGNRAIQLVGKSIMRCIRSSDIAARYGGDEFIVLLPHSTPEASNKALQRIRNSIYATTLKVGPKMVRISVSTGLATFPGDGADPGVLLAAADKAMYLDKALRRTKEFGVSDDESAAQG